MSSLLSDAADWFKRRETVVQTWYDDDVGRYAFKVTVDGQPMIVTAKEYLNDGDASFFADKVVQRAKDQDALILLFVFNSGKRLLFRPTTVQEVGVHRTAEQKRQKRGEDWIDIDSDHAASFRGWYEGREEPDTARDIKERPHDITSWGDTDE